LAVEVTRVSLQSWLKGFVDVFCRATSADHDCVLHTPDEPRENPVDIDTPGIYRAIPFCHNTGR